jgi:hypothetical protein
LLEISAGGPTARGIYNPFNNPNGTIQDKNGVDTGSVYVKTLTGTKGSLTLNGLTAGLLAGLNQVVRVTPLKDGKAIGEASDVSSVTMDGVVPLDGGSVEDGWAINPNGTDGFLTSAQTSASGSIVSSVDVFDQNGKTTQEVDSVSNSAYFTIGAGIFGNDMGLVGLQDASGNNTYQLLEPVTSGNLTGAWTPTTSSSQYLTAVAANWTNDSAVIQYYQGSSYYALTSQLFTNTNLTAYNTSSVPAVENMDMPFAFGIAEDPTTDTAVVPYADLEGYCVAPVFVDLNLSTGALSSFTGIGNGDPNGIAIDPVHDVGVVPTSCDGGLTFYNLQTNAGNEAFLPGANLGISGLFPVTDSTNSLALVEQTTDPDFETNNNSLSDVDVFDQQGHYIKTLARFSLFNTTLNTLGQELQINPSQRTGFIAGPNQQQIIPFSY